MKSRTYLILLIIFALSLLPLSAQVNLTQGLVGKYCLDGDAVDNSSLQNHGTIHNASAVQDRFGKNSGAISFTGSNSYVAIPANNAVFSTQYTYSFWYNAASNPASGQARVMLGVGGGTYDQTVGIANGYFNQYWGVTCGGYTTPPVPPYGAAYTTLPPLNQWNHVAAVKKADSIKLYINGVLVASNPAPTVPTYQGVELGIKLGGRANHNQYFNGILDDLWLYNRALTDEEIAAIYQFDGNFSFSLGSDTTTCGTFSKILDCAVDNATYLWSTGATTRSITVTTPGTFWVRVNKQCVSKTDSLIIDGVSLGTLPDSVVKCSGDSVLLAPQDLSGGSVLGWNTGETGNSIYAKDTGVYWIEIENSVCIYSLSTRVRDRAISVPALGVDTVACQYPLVLYPGTTPGSIYWSDGSNGPVLPVNQPGLYWVRFTENGCHLFDSIQVTTLVRPPSLLPPDTLLCPGISMQLSAQVTGGSDYLWSHGVQQALATFDTAGMYSVQYKVNACPLRDSVLINGIPVSTGFFLNDSLLCPGASVTYTFPSAPQYGYEWENGSDQNSRTLDTGRSYILTIRYETCSVTDTVTITNLPEPDVPANFDTVLCYSQPLDIDFSIDPFPAQYTWSDGVNGAGRSIAMSQALQLSIQTQCSTYSRSVNVEFLYCDSIYIPTSFSPNGDGKNDSFSISLINPVEFWIRIYDRWGEEIYATKDPNFVWRPIYRDEALTSDVYIYIMQVLLPSGDRVVRKGILTVLR